MKTILVTGAAGFIGSHLSEKLINEGYNVIGVDNFDAFYPKEIKLKNIKDLLANVNFKLYEFDLRNINSLNVIEDQIDCVVHLAAKAGVLPSLNNPQEYINSNILGTQNVLDYMKLVKCNKLVFASSSSIYGNNKKIPFSEEDIVDFPISPYASSKKACELINHTYHYLYNFDVLNLRFFTVYGPRQRPDLAIHKFTKLILNGDFIRMYGDGSTKRDYTFIDDTVSGIIASIEYLKNKNNVYEIINLGNNKPTSLSTLINELQTTLGVKANITQENEKPGDVKITYADISKAEKLLNYKTTVSFKEGIRKFIDWCYEK